MKYLKLCYTYADVKHSEYLIRKTSVRRVALESCDKTHMVVVHTKYEDYFFHFDTRTEAQTLLDYVRRSLEEG